MLVEVKSLLNHIIPYLPFLGAAIVNRDQLNMSALISRLLEVGIIGLVLMYGSVQVMDSKLAGVEKQINSVSEKVEETSRVLHNVQITVEGVKHDIKYLKSKE